MLNVIDIGTLHDVSIVSYVEVTDNIVSVAKLDKAGYTIIVGNRNAQLFNYNKT